MGKASEDAVNPSVRANPPHFRGESDPSPRGRLSTPPARRVGHRRQLFRWGHRGLMCGASVARSVVEPRGGRVAHGRAGAERGILEPAFFRRSIYLDIITIVTNTTTITIEHGYCSLRQVIFNKLYLQAPRASYSSRSSRVGCRRRRRLIDPGSSTNHIKLCIRCCTRADLPKLPQTVVALVPKVGSVGKHRRAVVVKPIRERNAAVAGLQVTFRRSTHSCEGMVLVDDVARTLLAVGHQVAVGEVVASQTLMDGDPRAFENCKRQAPKLPMWTSLGAKLMALLTELLYANST